MRKTLLFLCAFLAFSVSFAAVTDGGNIKSVSLYRNGATIFRDFTVHLTKGDGSVIIKNMPVGADINSVRVNPKDSGIKITGTDTEKTYLNPEKNDKITALKAQMDTIDKQIRKLSDDADTLKSSVSFLKTLNPFSQNQKATQNDIDDYMKYMEKTVTQKNDKIAELSANIKTLKDQRDAIQNEINAQKAANGESMNFIVSVTSASDKDASFDLSYNVSDAGWEPVYELRADSSAYKADISAYASVRQSMGEDWKNVKLDISTLMPTSEELPQLDPWVLDIYKSQPVAKSFYSEMAIIPRESMTAPAPNDDYAPAMTEDSTSFSFVLPGRVSIPSDGQPHRILLKAESVSGEFVYYAVPKLSDKAFLTANLKNPFAFPILSGKMGIYLDDRMVSASEKTEGIIPGGDMTVSLGTDDSIKIERKLVKNTGSSGIFGKTERVVYDCDISVQNKKGKAIDINVSEPIPVSRNEQIKVTLGDYTKDNSAIDDDNIITWMLKVKPSQTAKVKLGYKIEYPEDANVTGLQ